MSDDSLAHMRGQIKQAIKVLRSLTDSVDSGIPGVVLKQAKALVLLTQLKGGFAISYMVGSGIIIRRLDSGKWSGPSSISTGGLGLGVQAGARKTDAVIVLFNDDAVKAFSGDQVKLGADVAVALGPFGRELSADARLGNKGFATSFAYSHSQGAYGGYSFEGELIFSRTSDNEEYYGRLGVTVPEILNGEVSVPEDDDVHSLHALLAKMAQ